MDLFDQLQPKPYRMEVKHPGSGEGTGLFLDLVPISDRRVKAAERAYVDSLNAKGGAERANSDELSRLKVAAAVVGFEFAGDATWRGEKPEFSEELRAEILGNEKVYEQVIVQVANDRNFFPV